MTTMKTQGLLPGNDSSGFRRRDCESIRVSPGTTGMRRGLLPGQRDRRQKLEENFGCRQGVSEERCPQWPQNQDPSREVVAFTEANEVHEAWKGRVGMEHLETTRGYQVFAGSGPFCKAPPSRKALKGNALHREFLKR
jgi:hypothetical protein